MFAPRGGWRVEDAYNSLFTAGRIHEVILVGIDNSPNRMSEYLPPPPFGGGTAHMYLSFLTNEVMPYIEAKYRVLRGPTNNSILGSSAGGNLAFYAGWEASHIFGKAARMSPAFWYNPNYLPTIRSYSGPKKPVSFWIDAGNRESNDLDGNGADRYIEFAHYMTIRLMEIGWTYGDDLLLHFDYTGIHDEDSWGPRIEKPQLYFYGTPSTTVTNLTAFPSVPILDATGNVPNVLLFITAYLDNGLDIAVPLEALSSITSAQSGLWTRSVTDRIILVPNAVTTPTTIHLNIEYGGMSTQTSLEATTNLSSTVNLQLEITAPTNSGAHIYMVGNNTAVGDWDPVSGFFLYQASQTATNKTFTNTLVIQRNSQLFFKFCSGPAWIYVERSNSGNRIENRPLPMLITDTSYQGTVQQWRSVP